MSAEKSTLRVSWKEYILTGLLGGIPTPIGKALRNIVYRTIFSQFGKSVDIQFNVRFIGTRTIEIGDNVRICSGSYLINKGNKICLKSKVTIERGVDIRGYSYKGGYIHIGENTYIGSYVCMAGPGFIKIGQDCLIASHSSLYANNHIFVDPNQRINKQGSSFQGIVIEDDCWLGTGVRVLDGVTIGQGSIIGAGAVVTKDIPPFSVAVGVPARPISNRKSNQLVSAQERNCLPVTITTALAEVEKTAELLHQCLQTANGEIPLHLVFEKHLHGLLEYICQFMQVDTVTVLLRSDGHQLAVHATLGLEEEIAEEVRIPIGRGFAGRIAAGRESMIVEDLSQVEVVSPILRNKGIRSMLGVPLLVEERMIGVFHVGTYNHRQFDRDDAQFLKIVADRMAAAIAVADCSRV